MQAFDPALINEYIAESKEHLSDVESDFINLENNLQNPSKESIHRVFRAIHTIKGASGFFNLTAISRVSHTMETLLAMVREEERALTSEMLDTLLSGIDMLNLLLDDIHNSNNVNVDKILLALNMFVGPSDDLKEMKLARFESEDEENSFFEVPESILAQFEPGINLYEITFNLGKLERESGYSPVTFIHEILNVGGIIEGSILESNISFEDDMMPEQTIYKIIYNTVIDSDLIKDAFPIQPESIQKLKIKGKDNMIKPIDQKEIEPIQTNESNQKMKCENMLNEKNNETLRVRVDILDNLMMLAGELVLVRNQQLMHSDRQNSVLRNITQRLDIVTSELQETIMRTRMQPIGTVFTRFNRIVRDMGKKLGKSINIELVGNEVELDKSIIEGLVDPLTHLIRNSCDHGIEKTEDRKAVGKPEVGTIKLTAYHEGGQININIKDDGKGISPDIMKQKALEKGLKTEVELNQMNDKEIISLIFLPGFSTAEKVTDVSGRGVGMDVVKTSIERLGGIIDLNSSIGKGTEINLRLPLTLAIIPSLIVQVGKQRYAIPQINLEELVCLYDEDVKNKIECAGNREVYRLRDTLLSMVRLDDILSHSELFDESYKAEITENSRKKREVDYEKWVEAKKNNKQHNLSLNFAVLKVGGDRFGLIIDKIYGTEEIVVKPMHRAVKDLGIYSGATVLGDGKVALILDVLGIARHANLEMKNEEEIIDTHNVHENNRRSLLLFSNDGSEQFAISMEQIKRIEKLEMNKLECVGKHEFITIDGISTRIIRLDRCLDISSSTDREEMFMMLPKESKKPYGVLINNLIDIGEYTVNLNQESYKEQGVEGSAIINEQMTLLLEPDVIVKQAEPVWYA